MEEEGEDGEEREGAKGRPQAEKAGRREPALKEQPRAFESRRGGLNEQWRERLLAVENLPAPVTRRYS